jgi:hypothetical protein
MDALIAHVLATLPQGYEIKDLRVPVSNENKDIIPGFNDIVDVIAHQLTCIDVVKSACFGKKKFLMVDIAEMKHNEILSPKCPTIAQLKKDLRAGNAESGPIMKMVQEYDSKKSFLLMLINVVHTDDLVLCDVPYEDGDISFRYYGHEEICFVIERSALRVDECNRTLRSVNICGRLGCGVKLAPEAKRCGRCRRIAYCSRECQKVHWSEHKKNCVAPPAIKSCSNLLPEASELD